MTIKARVKFSLPLFGEVNLVRKLKPGKEIFVKQNPISILKVTVLDNDTTGTVSQYIDGIARVTKEYVDERESINERDLLKGIRTKWGEVRVFWEPTLPSQARK